MTKSKGIGRGKHGNHARGPRNGNSKENGGSGKDSGPHFWLRKYKTTQRPRPCQYCGQNAYYYHPDFWYLCAAHLLDLINVGEMLWKWTDWEEVWQRTEQLLRRPAPSIGADAMNERVQKENAQNL